MNIINNHLLATLEAEFDDDHLHRFQKEVLAKAETSSVRGVLIDVSKVRVLDSYQFSELVETARMISLLGSKPVFVGFQAGVASSLIDFDVDLESIETAITVQDGLEQLDHAQLRPLEEAAIEEEDTPDNDQPETNGGNAW